MKKFTQTIFALALMVMGAVSANAQEEVTYTPLTASMYHVWDGVGADAQPTDETPNCEFRVDEEMKSGAALFGDSNVRSLQYADLTGYDVLVMEGTTGKTMRLLFNRTENEGAVTEFKVTFDAEGYAEFDLTQLEYVHLNCIKVNWSNDGTIVTRLEVGKKEKAAPNPYTALSEGMFKAWDGAGADAQATDGSVYFQMNLNTELKGGDVVYGNGSVNYLQYADLTGYEKLVMEGTAGKVLRVMFNRVEHEGALTEIQTTFDSEGYAEVDLTQLEYAHLNCIKVNWGNEGTTVTRLDLYKEQSAGPDEPVDTRYTDLRLSMFHVWDGIGADAQQTGEAPYCEVNLNKELVAGNTIFGNGNVKSLQYADLTGYEELVFNGTPGVIVRVLMNRVSDSIDPVTILETIDANGYARVDLTSYEYAHLNCIKVGWGSPSGKVTSIQLFKNDETVGISTVSTREVKADACYDMQGRRVAQPTKGLYIMNGKKIVVK